jgi:hypothetical protein
VSVARPESSNGVDLGFNHDHALRKASERATQIECAQDCDGIGRNYGNQCDASLYKLADCAVVLSCRVETWVRHSGLPLAGCHSQVG